MEFYHETGFCWSRFGCCFSKDDVSRHILSNLASRLQDRSKTAKATELHDDCQIYFLQRNNNVSIVSCFNRVMTLSWATSRYNKALDFSSPKNISIMNALSCAGECRFNKVAWKRGAWARRWYTKYFLLTKLSEQVAQHSIYTWPLPETDQVCPVVWQIQTQSF